MDSLPLELAKTNSRRGTNYANTFLQKELFSIISRISVAWQNPSKSGTVE